MVRELPINSLKETQTSWPEHKAYPCNRIHPDNNTCSSTASLQKNHPDFPQLTRVTSQVQDYLLNHLHM